MNAGFSCDLQRLVETILFYNLHELVFFDRIQLCSAKATSVVLRKRARTPVQKSFTVMPLVIMVFRVSVIAVVISVVVVHVKLFIGQIFTVLRKFCTFVQVNFYEI